MTKDGLVAATVRNVRNRLDGCSILVRLPRSRGTLCPTSILRLSTQVPSGKFRNRFASTPLDIEVKWVTINPPDRLLSRSVRFALPKTDRGNLIRGPPGGWAVRIGASSGASPCELGQADRPFSKMILLVTSSLQPAQGLHP